MFQLTFYRYIDNQLLEYVFIDICKRVKVRLKRFIDNRVRTKKIVNLRQEREFCSNLV
jgi:hypothetical protein